ncbi:primosomal protein DnaI [Bombilactobacillus folatiphilus]|uniref:Primosomal protein DnaI n=1 Tax=Bombilactobacillus folatiphilus TaxID=2923362 RepID=A0ABY4PAL8_9LACO|nr:primosomal protein DnaI [Bombilactobacillus folatiphilus]UQS82650.1 primosomal protein DnaI [Bombilactobacillus folatiphilus]
MEKLSQSLSRIIKDRKWQDQYQDLLAQAVKDPDVQQFLQEHQAQVNEAILQQGLDAIYEFVQAKKHMNAFAAGYQPRLIFKNRAIQVSYEPDQELIAHKEQQRFEQNFMTIDMSSDIKQADLTAFAQGASGRQNALAAAYRFVIDYTTKPQFTPGLYLSGDFGIGKTYLLAAIAKELVQNQVAVLLIHFPTFTVQMKNAIHDNSVLSRIDQIKTVPILMLDDIGADSLSSWIRDEVLGVILQYRMQEQLPTFFSSNFAMKDLEKHLTINQRGDQEPIKAARIMERVRYLSHEVILSGPNRRFEK